MSFQFDPILGRYLRGRIGGREQRIYVKEAGTGIPIVCLHTAGAAGQDPWYDTNWLHRANMHGGEVCAALISGLIAPGGPEADRHETLWHYMQSGPGIFKGDLWFYRVDGDLRETIARIDTTLCPLWLLTGELDFSCRPADTLATAEAIPGCTAGERDRLGHFPMSENHDQFTAYLRPVLEQFAVNTPAT